MYWLTSSQVAVVVENERLSGCSCFDLYLECLKLSIPTHALPSHALRDPLTAALLMRCLTPLCVLYSRRGNYWVKRVTPLVDQLLAGHTALRIQKNGLSNKFTSGPQSKLSKDVYCTTCICMNINFLSESWLRIHQKRLSIMRRSTETLQKQKVSCKQWI